MRSRLGWICVALCLTVAVTAADSDAKRIRSYHRDAVKAQDVGSYDNAAKFHRRALELIAQDPDFPPIEKIRHMSNLGTVLNLGGEAEEALSVLREAQQLAEQQLSTPDPGLEIVLDLGIAKSLALLGRYDESEPIFVKSLNRIETAGVMDTLYGAEAHNGYGYLLWKTDRFSKAVDSYEKALEFFSTRLKPTHPSMVRLENELAFVRAALEAENGD